MKTRGAARMPKRTVTRRATVEARRLLRKGTYKSVSKKNGVRSLMIIEDNRPPSDGHGPGEWYTSDADDGDDRVAMSTRDICADAESTSR